MTTKAPEISEEDKAVEMWKMKKLIQGLSSARGYVY